MSRPEALDWSIDNCTVQRALQVLGDRWSFVVLREVFNGIRRFDDMRTRTAIPRQVLTERLGRLTGRGCCAASRTGRRVSGSGTSTA